MRRSKGYGVHSPFAYRFVTDVMCARHAYYAYDDIESLCHYMAHRSGKKAMKTGEAQTIFRIVNYFNPQNVQHIGSCSGENAAVAALPCRTSRHWLYTGNQETRPMVCADRLITEKPIEGYCEAIAKSGEKPFVIVDALPLASDKQLLESVIAAAIDQQGVIVFRHINATGASQHLCRYCKRYAQRGMWFGNYSYGVFVALKKLPRQDFMLWL